MSLLKRFRATITPFIAGITLREILVFQQEHGFTGEYPLAKALFIIIGGVAGLGFLWCTEKFEELSARIDELMARQQQPVRIDEPMARQQKQPATTASPTSTAGTASTTNGF